MKKNSFIICISLTVLFFGTVVFAENPFSDLSPDHWAYDYIMDMVEERNIDGYSDGTFRPDENVTRAEFCKMAVTAIGKTIPNLDDSRKEWSSIKGIEGHWGEVYMNTMSQSSWGYREWFLYDNTNPDQLINRGEAAMGIADLIYGYPRSYIGHEDEIQKYLADKYSDADSFGGLWGTVYEASIKGFMSGYEDGTFGCGKLITRAELCTILCRNFSKDITFDLSDKNIEDSTKSFIAFDTILLEMDTDYYQCYKNANNRLQTINGSPYLSNKDLYVRLNTDLGDDILQKTVSELKRTAPAWGRTYLQNIIYFVQNDIEYLSDPNNRDYAKFPYETLYERGGDCEDKSILLCGLLTKAGYSSCLITFSDHVGVGIEVEGGIDNGYYYSSSDGRKFFYLESTSHGWAIGELPEELADQSATIIFPSI